MSRIGVALTACCLTSIGAFGVDDPRREAPAHAATGIREAGAARPATAEPVDPWVYGSMPDRNRRRLSAAYRIAVERVRSVPECAGLFARLRQACAEMSCNFLKNSLCSCFFKKLRFYPLISCLYIYFFGTYPKK